jgi:Zn-dependent protease with chaperone function
MQARLYNARTSEQVAVELRLTSAELFVDFGGSIRSYPLESVRFSDRLGNMPRSIYLSDGCVCETDDNDGIDAFLRELKRHRGSLILHHLESKLRYVVTALITTALFSYVFVLYGLPSIAEHVAHKIPAPVVYNIGTGTLQTLDKLLLQPSELAPARQKELSDYFMRYVNNDREWPKIRLAFRSGRMGPNAMALPDGTIVFTDDLVNLAQNDAELLGVFFHELGHVQKRHAIRTVLQDSAFYLLISAITGDATSASSLLAALPTMLVESNYSREMEVEADDYAYAMMERYRIPHRHFAEILTRLLEHTPEPENERGEYLSSHPLTPSRIEKFSH